MQEAVCLSNTTTASPAAEQVPPLNGGGLTSPRYHHNTTTHRPDRSTEHTSIPSTPCQVPDSITEFGHVSVSGPKSANDFTDGGCSLSTAASSVNLTISTTTIHPDASRGAGGGKNSVTNVFGGYSDEAINAASSGDSMRANRKSFTGPEIAEDCRTTTALPPQSRMTEDLNNSTVVVTISPSQVTTGFLPHETTGERGHAERSMANTSRNETYSEKHAVDNSNNINNSNSNNSLWTTALNYENLTTAREIQNAIWTTTVDTVSADDMQRNRTFNFVFDGNCFALKRRGPAAEKRFQSVVVDALSSGLSVSSERLVAGELRCGSLNLSVTMLDAYDEDVQWMMSTLAAATLRVSVEDIDETFVLLRVELVPLPSVDVATMTQVMSRHVATTNRPHLGQASVAILVVFIIIGALAVFAGTVSAAIYLYFRRMYCRTFVVNRRALRWSSRASDTVQVINVDDDDGSSGGGASSRAAPANDAVEWSPPISGSDFDEGRLAVGFGNWSPHYCQARFRRLIAPPPPTLTSLPELLDDEEATVDITSDSSFHPRRPSSCIIHLLQPRELHIGSADSDRDVDYQCNIRKQDIGLSSDTTLDWTTQDFPTSNKKERATPF